MKYIYLILLLFVLCSCGQDFRNVNWGMSKEEVIKHEAAKLIENNEDNLVYQTKLSSMNFFLNYFFIDNKLIEAKYVINELKENIDFYKVAYDIVIDDLFKKYKIKPIEQKEDSNEGVSIINKWNIKNTSIECVYANKHGAIILWIVYKSNKIN